MNTEKQINIFIVDDNRIFSLALRAGITAAFKTKNIKIHSFATGEKCLERLECLLPELIILDYNLNSKSAKAADGLQVLDKIKKINNETSVIILTSDDHIETALKSFHHGASDYVVKNENHFNGINESIETIFALKELVFQNNEKRAAEVTLSNIEIAFQKEEREKREAELNLVSMEKAQVEKSKFIIEEKSKRINDSINYARRIQQAKLPRKEEIYASLPQSFVLFKPKDIVSGDFYFFHKNDHSSFIVAADCTGHGVPGAFMSMIGSEKLDDALAHSTDTSEILKHLNKGIKNSLHQSTGKDSSRDGMDIAICSVNTESRIVKYAGANRPFWLIRNGKLELEEIKATKRAIGGLTEDDQHFETHELELQKGDTFYIFTDGYADQFGAQHGKKLMTGKFKEILIEIQSMAMEDQMAHLEDFIEDWKNGIEQLDDMLVIGVRL